MLASCSWPWPRELWERTVRWLSPRFHGILSALRAGWDDRQLSQVLLVLKLPWVSSLITSSEGGDWCWRSERASCKDQPSCSILIFRYVLCSGFLEVGLWILLGLMVWIHIVYRQVYKLMNFHKMNMPGEAASGARRTPAQHPSLALLRFCALAEPCPARGPRKALVQQTKWTVFK